MSPLAIALLQFAGIYAAYLISLGCGVIMLAYALDNLYQSNPIIWIKVGAKVRARVYLEGIAWIGIALGAGAAIKAPFTNSPPPALPALGVYVGLALLMLVRKPRQPDAASTPATQEHTHGTPAH